MKTKFFMLPLVIVLLASTAQAHHPSGGTSSGSRSLIYSGTRSKPVSRAYLNYDWAHLDGSVGSLSTITLGGSYSFNRRVSLGASLPVIALSHNFRADSFGLGDAGVDVNVLLFENDRSFIFGASALTFPTGDEGDGHGRGAVGQTLDVSLGTKWGEWTPLVILGLGWGYESDSEPTLNVGAGIQTPSVLNNRLYGVLLLREQLYLASDTFSSSSGKLTLEPQAFVRLDRKRRLTMSIGGRVTIWDSLSLRPGVTLLSTSPALLNDQNFAATVGLQYAFQ